MDRDAAPFYPSSSRQMNAPRHSPSSEGSGGGASDGARRRRVANQHVLGSARVLVWEHAETQALTLRLRRLGCPVSECSCVETALQLHGDKAFDLILAAPGSGTNDPLGMLRLLRRALPLPPLVLVSTSTSVAMRLRCQELRPQYFATLPLEEAELRAILQLGLGPRSRPGSP